MSNLDNDFTLSLRLLEEMSAIKRWATFSTIKEENLCEHSYIVTFLARTISENVFVGKNSDRAKLLATTYAIFHDVEETFTGDILHDIKYQNFNGKKIKIELEEYVKDIVNKNFENGWNISNEYFRNNILAEGIPKLIKILVKIADWQSMLVFLKREEKLGNKDINEKTRLININILSVIHEFKNECENQNEFDYDLDYFKY